MELANNSTNNPTSTQIITSNPIVVELKQKIVNDHIRYCEKCGKRFTPEEVDIRAVVGAKIIASIKCLKCESGQIITINFTPTRNAQLEKVQLISDLEPTMLFEVVKRGKLTFKDALTLLKRLEHNPTVRAFLKKAPKNSVK